MGELVSDGTCFSCPFCSSKLKISVPDSLAEAEGKKLANTANSQFLAASPAAYDGMSEEILEEVQEHGNS